MRQNTVVPNNQIYVQVNVLKCVCNDDAVKENKQYTGWNEDGYRKSERESVACIIETYNGMKTTI